jgi:hypothetical protein
VHYKQSESYLDMNKRCWELEEDADKLKLLSIKMPKDSIAYYQTQRLIAKLMYERNNIIN